MKRFVSVLLIGIALCFASCKHELNIPEAQLKSNLDTLSYCLGVFEAISSESFNNHLSYNQISEDNAYDVLNGLYAGISNKEKEDQGSPEADEAYGLGFQMGEQLQKSRIYSTEKMIGLGEKEHLSADIMARGFADNALGKVTLQIDGKVLDRDGAEKTGDRIIQSISARINSEKYSNKEGVKALTDGIYYRVIKEGNGPKPKADSNVEVIYEGRLYDGSEFDATSRHDTPTSTLNLGKVIPGWRKAMMAMPVGSKWEIYIPSKEAYGEKGIPGSIPPYASLIFTIDFISIK